MQVRVCIKPILEVEELLTEADKLQVASFVSEKRRREVIAWRSLLRGMLLDEGLPWDGEICYSSIGAPYIIGIDRHFSVSHCSKYVAIVLSCAPCAIDIELKERDFLRAADRFSSSQERQLANNRLDVLWCAKETLYKYSNQNSLDLLSHLQITDIDLDGGFVYGKILDGEILQMHLLDAEDYICVYK